MVFISSIFFLLVALSFTSELLSKLSMISFEYVPKSKYRVGFEANYWISNYYRSDDSVLMGFPPSSSS